MITTDIEFVKACKEIVRDYVNEPKADVEPVTITTDDVFIVWQCKTLQNWKAMVSTTVSDGRYYELTYNGDKEEMYLDAYKKERNACIRV